MSNLFPQKGSTKRVVGGGALNVVSEIIIALKHIILAPIFLSVWGQNLYGEWLALYAVAAYFSLVSLGVQNYVTNKLVQTNSVGDKKGYSKVLGNTSKLYLVILIVSIVVLLFLSILSPLSEWLQIGMIDLSSLRIVLLFLCLHFLISVITSPVVGIYHSVGEYSKQSIIIGIREVSLLILLVVGLKMGLGVLAISMMYFVVYLLFLIFMIIDVLRRRLIHPDHLEEGSLKEGIGYLGPGIMFFLIYLSNTLKAQGTTLLVNSTMSSGSVASFSLHRSLVQLPLKVINSFKNSLAPELTASERRGDKDKLRFSLSLLVKLSLVFASTVSIALLFVGDEIFGLWLGDAGTFSMSLWSILLLSVPITALWSSISILPIAINQHKWYSVSSFISVVLGLALSLILSKSLGLIGVVLGLLLGEILVVGWIVPLQACRIVGYKMWRLVLLVMIVIVLSTVQILLGRMVMLSYGGVLGSVLGSSLVLLIGAVEMFVILDKGERSWLLSQAKRLTT